MIADLVSSFESVLGGFKFGYASKLLQVFCLGMGGGGIRTLNQLFRFSLIQCCGSALFNPDPELTKSRILILKIKVFLTDTLILRSR
jgi:hypothetical protein